MWKAALQVMDERGRGTEEGSGEAQQSRQGVRAELDDLRAVEGTGRDQASQREPIDVSEGRKETETSQPHDSCLGDGIQSIFTPRQRTGAVERRRCGLGSECLSTRGSSVDQIHGRLMSANIKGGLEARREHRCPHPLTGGAELTLRPA